MARYLVDTKNKIIHDLQADISSDKRSQCNIDKIKTEDRNDVDHEEKIKFFLRTDIYIGCESCFTPYDDL